MKIILSTNEGVVLGIYENVEDHLIEENYAYSSPDTLCADIVHDAQVAVKQKQINIEIRTIFDDDFQEEFEVYREI